MNRPAAQPLSLIFAATMIGSFALSIGADTIDVTTTHDSIAGDGFCSLREAVSAANLDMAIDACTAGSGPDIIQLSAGTYTLSIIGVGEDANATGDLDIVQKLAIVGLDGQNQVVIDGGGIDRVLHVLDNRLDLGGLTVTGGNGWNSYGGGGIYNEGLLVVSDTTISLNSASQGGGIYNANVDGADVRLDGVTISGNTASSFGGGIFNASGYTDSLKITDSTLSGNTSGESGGALWSRAVTISGSTVSDNLATENGGAFFWPPDSAHANSAVNTTFSGNQSGKHGGALYFDGAGGLFELRNVTITNNTADFDDGDDGNGGGIYNASNRKPDLANTVVAGNHDGSTGLGQYAPDCEGTLSSSGYNFVGAVSGFCIIDGDTTGNQTGAVGAELDPGLGTLAANGGSTLTHLPTTTSLLLDAADPAGCYDQDDQTLTIDQRGFTRPEDGPDDDEIATCDIGAVEFSSATIFSDDFENGTTNRWSDVGL